MNRYQDEFAAEHNRRKIIADMNHIRLEEIALKSKVYRPSRFERTMFNFANWMISTGNQLRKRYEIPATPCNNSQSKSFVH